MKPVIAITAAVLLSGCIPDDTPVYRPDQTERKRIFFKCLEAADGPLALAAAKKAGAGDIVKECAEAAFWMARRCVKNCGTS